MKITGIFIVILLFTTGVSAQYVSITEHDGIASLVRTFTQNHKQNSHIKGYRIQIVSTDDRRKMENAMYKCKQLYPEMVPDWEHLTPYYFVKVGAFRKKLDYQGFLMEVKKDFPSSIPIIEDIRKEELLH